MITTPSEELRSRLRQAMDQKSIDPTELARRIGRGPDYIRDFLNGRKATIKLAEFGRIEEVLDLAPGILFSDVNYKPAGSDISNQREMVKLLGRPEARPEDLMARLMPIYSVWEGGFERSILSTEVVDTVPVPWFMKESKKGYGILISSEDMTPAFEPGDIVVVNPILPLMKDKDYTFLSTLKTAENGNCHRFMLRRLLSWTEDEWTVQQHNPPSTQKYARREWIFHDRVIGKVTN